MDRRMIKKTLFVLMLSLLVVLLVTSCGKKEASSGGEEKSAIDVDLSKMSGTAVYAEVYNMVTQPKTYKGKMVKMKGTVQTAKTGKNGKRLFACIIEDATACCAQGIEFEATKDYSYPDDYPKVGYYVTVQGKFDFYKEGPYTYCVLKNAEIL